MYDSLTERIACRQFLRNCMYWFMYILQQPGFVFLLKIFNVAVVVWLIIKFDMEENTIGHSDNEKQSIVYKENGEDWRKSPSKYVHHPDRVLLQTFL